MRRPTYTYELGSVRALKDDRQPPTPVTYQQVIQPGVKTGGSASGREHQLKTGEQYLFIR